MRYSVTRDIGCFAYAAREQCGAEIGDALQNIAEDVETACNSMEKRKRGRLQETYM